MKKFEGLLFCTDLDGTLYTDDRTVSQENLDAIEYFTAEGGLFTFITGRPPRISRSICEILRPNAPFGCLNGGGIYDPEKQTYLWYRALPDEVAALVEDITKALPSIGIQFNTAGEIYFHRDNPEMAHFRAVTDIPYLPTSPGFCEPILKIVLAHHEEAQITALSRFLYDHPAAKDYGFIRSERTLYEILPKGVSKGGALQKLAELLGIDIRRTIAAGDYNNDISMLRAAGLGFAVANAVNEAKAAADHVTVSNNEHAIAAIVDGLDRGRFRL